MKAGRELDALVASKVMGWKYVGLGRSLNPDFIGNPKEGSGLDPVPPYSTDIASAWLVVEKVSGGYKEFFLSKKIYSGICDGDMFVAKFVFPGFSNFEEVEAISKDSAPHAICLAALKAVDTRKP